ncbi:hypothetical protein [Streptacidiphilus fuscans]|uniref:Uncharacterized protein n=1 Tax=Streptacidiphilus fuscans TaxID=2789292 RepID=A0A931BEK7_9ACTN|nr:hypothetical protein [Streptacidiphilus fuscans]MBF9072743.1 hypothetical protein [Streptacidiphilus fuscans]
MAASDGELVVFAAGVAERLIRMHESLPNEDQRDFTLSLRPLLNAVWEAAFGDSTAFVEIKQALGSFYLSDYCHNDGQDGPDDADDSAAAAVLYAAETYMHGCANFAIWVSGRAVEAVDQLLNQDDTHADDPDGVLAGELSRQLRDLDRIGAFAGDLKGATLGTSVDTSARLRAALYESLSQMDA